MEYPETWDDACKCPFCKSDDTKYTSITFDEPWVLTMEYYCMNCEREWLELYRFEQRVMGL